MAQKLTEPMYSLTIAVWQAFFGPFLLLMIGFPRAVKILSMLDWHVTLLITYTAFISAATFILWFTLLKYNKSGEIVLFRFLTLVFGADILSYGENTAAKFRSRALR